MGKGVGAALLMSNLQAAVRMLAPQVSNPRALCDRVNQVICANSVPGKFITFFFCIIGTLKRSISYTNAGHNWPILARSDGECERFTTKGVVLGTSPEWNYHQQEAELRSGDRLVLFIDGITESADAAGTEFGEDKLLNLISQNLHLPADELKALLMTSAKAHGGGVLTDDATLIIAAVR